MSEIAPYPTAISFSAACGLADASDLWDDVTVCAACGHEPCRCTEPPGVRGVCDGCHRITAIADEGRCLCAECAERDVECERCGALMRPGSRRYDEESGETLCTECYSHVRYPLAPWEMARRLG